MQSFTIKVALHLRSLTTEKFQNYETVKGGCIPSKHKLKTRINNKLRWLSSDINFKLPHAGYPIAHGITMHMHFKITAETFLSFFWLQI